MSVTHDGWFTPPGWIDQVLPPRGSAMSDEPATKDLRPDTGDGMSLECADCGARTPDAGFCDGCGLPYCHNCLAKPEHTSHEESGKAAEGRASYARGGRRERGPGEPAVYLSVPAPLVVKPGEVLVIQLPADTDEATMHDLREQLATAHPSLDGRILLIAGAEALVKVEADKAPGEVV